MKYSLMAAAATFALATGAQAASIKVTAFSDAAFSDMVKGNTVVEDFEDGSSIEPIDFEGSDGGHLSDGDGSRQFGELEEGTSLVSKKVGSFTGLGGQGTGDTCQNLSIGNDVCDNIALQFDPDLNGQGNIVPDLGQWSINAADTLGIEWSAFLPGGKKFTSLFFALRDAADQGATLSVEAAGMTEVFSNLGNNNEQLFLIDFGGAVSSATITMSNNQIDDSFSIDGASINAVPLPAPALLLLGGLGLMVGLRRRKAA